MLPWRKPGNVSMGINPMQFFLPYNTLWNIDCERPTPCIPSLRINPYPSFHIRDIDRIISFPVHCFSHSRLSLYLAPNAAAGYERSRFLRTVELLLELATDPVSLLFAFFDGTSNPGAMSAGRSFHSMSGRWFWKEPLWGSGARGGGGADDDEGRLTTAAVALRGTVASPALGGGEDPFVLLVDDLGGGGAVAFGRDEATRFVMLRRTIHAEAGRSFR